MDFVKPFLKLDRRRWPVIAGLILAMWLGAAPAATAQTNLPPTITTITNRTILEDTTTGAIGFIIDDPESNPNSLTLSSASSDTSLVPLANIVFSGSGGSGNRTVTVTPAPNAFGSTLISVNVFDGTNTTTETFTLTVTAVNDPPTIANIGTQNISEDSSAGPIAFTISDIDTPAGSLTLTGGSSALALVPVTNIVFGGSGANRTVTVTPIPNANGSATITVTVSDGTDSDSDSFTLNVAAVNDAPRITGPILTNIFDTAESFIFTNLTLSDVDHNNPSNETLVVTVSLAANPGIGSFGDGDTTVSLTNTPANLTAQLRSLGFTPDSELTVPVTGTNFSVQITLRDASINSPDNATRTVRLFGQNDPPTLATSANPAAFLDSQVVQPFFATPLDPDVGDVLTMTIQPLSDTNFSFGFLEPASPSFTGTPEGIAAAVRTVAYRPIANAVATNQVVTFRFRLNDASGSAVSNVVSLTIQGINDVPDIVGVPLDPVRIRDDETAFPFAGARIEDPDELGRQRVNVTIALDDPGKGAFDGPSTITNVTPEQATAAINLLRFIPTPNRVAVGQTEAVSFTIRVVDALGAQRVDNRASIIVTSVNSAPQITGVPDLSNQPLLIPPTAVLQPFAGIAVNDDDFTNINVTVSLDNPAKGVLTNLGGFVQTGPGTYSITALSNVVSAALTNLQFVVNTNFVFPVSAPGGTTFTITAVDPQLNTTVRALAVIVQFAPGNWLVTRTEDDLNPGSLRHAIVNAENNATISFALPTYPGLIRLKPELGSIQFIRNLTIKGPGADKLTITGDGDGNNTPDLQLFRVLAGATFEGVTLERGRAQTGGAAYVAAGGHLTLRYCTLSGHRATEWGGAVDVDRGRLTVEHCLFENNAVDAALGLGGGAVSLYTTQSCVFRNSTFSSNQQPATTGFGGGAIYAENFDPVVQLPVEIVHCTFAANADASGRGSAIHGNVFGTRIRLLNSIFADPSGRNLEVKGAAQILSLGGNLCADAAQVVLTQGGQPQAVTLLNQPSDLVLANALLQPLSLGRGPTAVHALTSGSPAISRAVAPPAGIKAESTDQLGVIRDASPDSGAVEFERTARLVVSEIQARAAVSNYVEFYVLRDSTPVDLSGYSLWVNQTNRHLFPPGTVVQPGFGIVVAGTNFAPVPTNNPTPIVAATSGSLGLGEGGLLELRPASTNLRPVISFVFNDRFVEPTGVNTNFPGNAQTLVPQFCGFALVPHSLVLPPPLGGADLARNSSGNVASPGADSSPTPFGLPNAFPLAVADELLVKEDDVVALLPLANDLDADGLDRLVIVNASTASDPGTNSAASAFTLRGAALSITPASVPLQGTAVVFDPRASTNLQQLAEGAKTTDEFYYTIIDYGTGTVLDYESTNGGLGLTLVSPAHRLKVGDVIQLSGVTETSYVGSHVITNVVDADRFSIGVPFVTNPPVKGSWTTAAPRSPTARSEARVLLTVLGANDAPQPVGDALTTGEETVTRIFADATLAGNTNVIFASDAALAPPRTVSSVSVLGNDRDPDTDDNATTLNVIGVVGAVNIVSNYSGVAGISPTTVHAPAHGLAGGAVVLVANYGGHPSYNGYHTITIVDANTFTIPVPFVDNASVKGAWVILNDANRLAATSAMGAAVTLEIRANRSETSFLYNPRTSAFLNGLALGEQAVDQFFYAVRDRHNAISLAPVSVTVNGVNDAPLPVLDPPALTALTNGTTLSNVLVTSEILYVIPAASGASNRVDAGVRQSTTTALVTNLWATLEDQALGIAAASLLANDADVDRSDVLQIQSVSGPSREGAAVSLSGDRSLITYNPTVSAKLNQLAREEQVLDSFGVVVTDDRGGSVASTVVVLVTGVNDRPTATDDRLSTFANQVLVLPPPGLLTNDSDPDINGLLPDDQLQLLPVALTNPATGGRYQIVSNTLTYDPTFSKVFPALGVGQTVNESFPYFVADSSLVFADDDRFQVGADGAGYELNVLANDRDLAEGGGGLRIVALGTPNNGGTVTTNVGGTRVIYSPEINFVGDEVFAYTAVNAQGVTDRGLVFVRVVARQLNGNLQAGADTFTVARGEAPLLEVLANDQVIPEGVSGLVITRIVTSPAVDQVVIEGGRIRYRQQSSGPFPYTQTFRYEVSGGGSALAVGTVTVKVIDRAGTLNVRNDAFSVPAGSVTNALDVLVNDQLLPGAATTLQVIAQGPAVHGSLTRSGDGRTLFYTPPPGFVGVDQFGYTASDGLGGTGTGLVSVVVGTLATSGDFFAVPFDDSGSTNDNGISELDVLANDPVIKLAGGTNVTIVAVSPASSALGTLSIQPGARRLGIDPAPDQTGELQFTYTISDGNGGTATERGTVIVAASGLKANSDNFTVPLNSPVTLFNVLGNDVAIPDQGRTITIVSLGSGPDAPNRGGTVAITPAGNQLEYTPAPGFTGVETFTYTITDAFRTDTAKVVVNVTAGALAANNDAFTVFYELTPGSTNQPRTFTLNLLANDRVVPNVGQVLTITGVGVDSTVATNAPGRAGVVSIAPGGTALRYTPGDDDGPFPYTERFTYEISDGTAARAEGTVVIEVQKLADARNVETQADFFQVARDSVGNALPVLLNDGVRPATANGWALSAVSATTFNAPVTISGTNLLYTPPAGFVGVDEFSYSVSDGTGGTGTARVRVQVGETTLNADRFTVMAGSVSNALNVIANDGLLPIAGTNYQVVAAGPGTRGGAISATNGVVFYTPLGSNAAPYLESFPYVVADSAGGLATGSVAVAVIATGADRDEGLAQIAVLGANDLPVISGVVTGQTVYMGGAIRPFARVTVSDIDYQGNEPLVIRIRMSAANRGILIAPSGLISEGGGNYRIGSPGSGLTPANATAALREVVFLPTASGRVTPGNAETTRFDLEADDQNGGVVGDNQTVVTTLAARVAAITPPPTAGATQFGAAVAASRDTVVVGLPAGFSVTPSRLTGTVHIYQRSPGDYAQWNLVKVLEPSSQVFNSVFGQSVAISGDTVLVGAPVDAFSNVFGGTVYVYGRDVGGTNEWGLIKRLADPAPGNLRGFGHAVAIDGDLAVVGTPNDFGATPGAGTGSATLFRRDEGGANNWGVVKKLTAADSNAGDRFGESVAASGDTVVVGARLADLGATDAGAAYIFERHFGGTNNWGQAARLLAGDATGGDQFGTATVVGANIVAIGAPLEDDGAADSGAVYLFERTGSGTNLWQQTTKLKAPSAVANARHGTSVSVSHNFLLAGAPGGFGSVQVFRRGPYSATWTWADALLPQTPQNGADFGHAVAVGGLTAAVGARFQSNGGIATGSVSFHRLLFNNTPAALTPLADQTVTVGNPFQFVVPENAFADPDMDDVLTWTAESSPAWLAFNGASRTFSGTASVATNHPVTVRVTDLDGATATNPVVFVVINGSGPAPAPVVLKATCVNGNWQISYPRSKAGPHPAVGFETSTNLTSWIPATGFTIVETIQSIDATQERVILTITPPAALTGTWFFRAIATP